MAAYDLIVIGGGINGAGIARDAALRGLRVCLLEQADLCNSTTRWSSRLIHGGLRYLEFGELGLVHESLQERETLLRNAPHLVRPLPLLIPVYERSRRALTTIQFGLWIYDLLSLGRSLPGHRRLSREETLAAMPGLAPGQLTGSARYFDAQVTFPERLVVENVLDAHAAGADIRTRHAVERILSDHGRVRGVVARSAAGVETLTSTTVVNAAGPWVDQVLRGADHHLPRLLGPTRGTHVVVPRFDGLGDGALYTEAHADGRPFFIIPWNGLVLVGTTDIHYGGDPADARPTEAEIAYLLQEVRTVFPATAPGRDQVLYAYAGVRPLPRQGQRETAAITRRHLVRQHTGMRGLLSVIGGKLTTYRSLAEEVVDQVVTRVGASAGRPLSPCRTADEPLPGGRAGREEVLRELAGFADLEAPSAVRLWDLYGSRAVDVAALTRDDVTLARPICDWSHGIAAEVVFALREEFATSLTDVFLRRSMMGLSPDLGERAFPRALHVARRHFGWSDARCRAESRAWEDERDVLRSRPPVAAVAGEREDSYRPA